jgi:hypothetical protein
MDIGKPLPLADVEALGRYNAERGRGIVHNPETDERMAKLQQKFDERMKQLDDLDAWADAELEAIRRSALPRWFVWLCVAIAVGGVLFGILRELL